MPMPRPDAPSKQFFTSILPQDPRVQVRPMFGNLAGFVNGNMFAGLYGAEVFLRLPAADRAELLREKGAVPFEPMQGHAMAEYVVPPDSWRDDPNRARGWVSRSLQWVGAMPAKKTKSRKG